MHFLVTGGTGFIGHALCDRLVKDGHTVTVRTRNKERSFGLLPHAVNLVQEYAEIRRATPPDLIINLAGESLSARRWTEARKQAFFDSRVSFTRDLVDYLQSLPQRPKALLSASAIGYYGARGDESLTEDAPAGNEFQADLCRLWEAEAQRAETPGLRVCRMRFGVVLGPDGGALGKMLPPFRFGFGGPIGSGRQWLSWIHRDDLVEMIVWLATRPDQSGAFNATAPKPVMQRDFAKTLGAVLGRPAVVPTPPFALRVAFGEMAHLLSTGQKVLPARALIAGFKFRFPDLEPALRDVLGQSVSGSDGNPGR